MEYTINTLDKTLYAKFTGFVESETLIHNILNIRSDRHFQDGYNLILDFTEADVPKGYMEIAEVAEFVKATSVVRESFKMAILVGNAEQLRSANLYALLVRQDHVLVCETLQSAEKWVAGVRKSTINKPEQLSDENSTQSGNGKLKNGTAILRG